MPLASSLPVLLTGFVIAAVLVAWLAGSRGRSVGSWLFIALVVSPIVAVGLLWLLADLEHDRRQTREFLNQAKQRRNRRDPHDTFSRTRERQEQEIHTKAITARHERERRAQLEPDARAREKRTPPTFIMPA